MPSCRPGSVAASLDQELEGMDISFRELIEAGVVHRGRGTPSLPQYRRSRQSVLADFFIGAHAAVLGCAILTRDGRRYQRIFRACRSSVLLLRAKGQRA